MPNFMYIGPNCPQKGLKYNNLFKDEPNPPSGLVELIEEYKQPIFRALYVNTAALGEARKNLRIDPQCVESQAYKRLLEIIRKMPR